MVRGAAFLRLFLDDVLGMPVSSEEELNRAVVTTEYLIDQERRIDIVIEQLTDSTDKELITMIANDLAASAEKLKAGKSNAFLTRMRIKEKQKVIR